ncbi:DUF4190 domain-containing protein [Nonomuraea sp. NPDC002799]
MIGEEEWGIVAAGCSFRDGAGMYSPYGGEEQRPLTPSQPVQPPPQYGRQPPPQPTSGAAVASLIFGLIGLFLSWCLFGIPSILAIVFGHVASRTTKRGLKPGHGMAVAGLILGYVVVVPVLIVSVLVLGYAPPESIADWINTFFTWLFAVVP